MKKIIMMQSLAVAILTMSLLGGCGKSDDGGAAGDGGEGMGGSGTPKVTSKSTATATLSFMPASAVGVVHIDVAKTCDDITAAAKKDEETFGPILGSLDTLKKIDSLDAYIMISNKKPTPVIVIRGSIGPDDIIKGALKLAKGDNGRYMLEGMPFVVIIGNEADDVPAGVVLAGVAPMLTPEFVAALGKKNTDVEALIAKVDTSAHIWGGITFPEKTVQEEGYPKQMFGTANITGTNPMDLTILFDNEAKAAQVMIDFDKEAPPFIKEHFAFKRDGLTVTAKMIGEGNLIDNATKMLKGFMASLKAPPAEQPAPAPAPAPRE
jgi:hypothetical protein